MTAPGLTWKEIRKAEELADWEFTEESIQPEKFRDHLTRFAGRTTDRYVRRKLQALPWADPATRTCIEAAHKFEKEFLRMAVWISSGIFRCVE
jgi:hypothetical protein